MRFLILTWLYEPNSTPRATRWKTVAREMVKMGFHVDVVTSRAPGQSQFEVVAGVQVHRCGSSAGDRLSSFAKGDQAGTLLATLLRQVHQRTWRKLYWPDKACLWLLPAVRCADRLLRENRYDGLITVSLPFTAHLAGYLLKRSHPALPWLADVGDPFSCQNESAPNNPWLHGRRNRIWEAKVLDCADRVAVTNPAMADLYATLFPASAAKLAVIPPVLGSDVLLNGAVRVANCKIRLLFLGTLYRKIRNPRYLLEAFEQLLKGSQQPFELHFAGDVGDCADLVAQFAIRLGRNLIVHGKQPRGEALRMLLESDFVINIGNTTPFQLPSKLVEYVAMGKLIVNLSSCDKDSSTLFLKDYPGVFTMQQTQFPTAPALAGLQRFLSNPPAVPASQIGPWLKQFSPCSIAGSYLAALNLATAVGRAA